MFSAPPARCSLLFCGLLLAGCGDRHAQGPSRFEGAVVIGEAGRQPGQFSRPRAVAFTKSGMYVVIDRTGRVQLYSAKTNEFVRQWRLEEWDKGTPTGVTVDPIDDTIWIADTHYARILQYDQDGNLVFRFGELGEEPGKFVFPTDICPDPDGKTLWITDYGRRNRVMKFTRSGEFITEWGSRDYDSVDLGRPMAISLSPDSQRLYVVDAGNNCIRFYDREGKSLGSFGVEGAAPGEIKYPLDLALAPDGTLYVVEYGNSRITHFDANGGFLGLWGEPGHAPGQLFSPWGCAVSLEGDLLIADTNNQRLQLLHHPARLFRMDVGESSSKAISAAGRSE